MPELREYQKKAVNFLVKRRRAVLGSQVRTGKTPVLIKAADFLLPKLWNPAEPTAQAFVICPSNVKLTFAEQIERFSDYGHSLQVIESGKDKIDPNKRWIVMSYHLALIKFTEIRENRGQPPFIVIMDEAHRVKNIRARTAKELIGKDSIVRNSRHVWLATGTPFPNNLIDCYALFNFCLYGKLGKYWDFADKHCYVKSTFFGGRPQRKAYGCKQETLGELTELVTNILHRDTLEAIRPELPMSQHVNITIEHTDGSEHICRGLAMQKSEAQDAIENDIAPQDPELMKMRRLLAVCKVKQAVDFISDKLEDYRPIVVCAKHIDLIDGIRDGLKKDHIVEVIKGGVPQKKRDEIRLSFQAGKIDCLIISIEAGGEGVDLSASNMMIIAEEEWSPRAMEQVRGRILSLAKADTLTYYYLMFPDFKDKDGTKIESIDKGVHRQLAAKTKTVEKFWAKLENREDVTPLEGLEAEVSEELDWSY